MSNYKGFRSKGPRDRAKRQVLTIVYGESNDSSTKPFFTKSYPCYFCKKEFSFSELTVEHLMPVSRGGAVKDVRNLEVACKPCNNKKSDKTVDELVIAGAASYLFPRRGIREEEK